MMKPSIPGSTHSEALISAELDRIGVSTSQVTRIFTERAPCSNCSNIIKNYKNATTTWSVPFTKEGNKALRNYYKLMDRPILLLQVIEVSQKSMQEVMVEELLRYRYL